MSVMDFIKPELVILIPVMYFIGIAIKKSPVKDYLIPFILGSIGILIATVYVLATTEIESWQNVMMAIFISITQGIMTAGTSVFANQLFKQAQTGISATNFINQFNDPAADPLMLVDLVKSGNRVRSGQIQRKNKIVIHDTGNYNDTANSSAHAKYLHNLASLNTTYLSWHYTVDADRIIQHIPDEETAWHAGDSTKSNGGNMSGIGIEMCVNDMENFDQVLKNTAWLVGSLLYKYSWSLSAVVQHYDCNGKNCPFEIRKKAGQWEKFLEMCQQEYDKLAGIVILEQYFRVQVGAWKNKLLAQIYADKLRKVKIDGEPVDTVIRFYDGFYRVQVGAWSHEFYAKAYEAKLQKYKIDDKPVQTTIKYY